MSATDRSLIQRDPTLRSGSEFDLDTSTMRRPTTTTAVERRRKVCNPLPSLNKYTNIYRILFLSFHEALLTKQVFSCAYSMQYFTRPRLKSGIFSVLYFKWLSYFSDSYLMFSLELHNQSRQIHYSLF